MEYREIMQKQALALENVDTAIQNSSEQQLQAMERMQAGFENAVNMQTFATVASSTALAKTFQTGLGAVNSSINRGFSDVNNSLGLGFSVMSLQLRYMTSEVSAGFNNVATGINKMSLDICDRLDALQEIAKSPLYTEFRELYRRAIANYNKGFFVDVITDLKTALEKNRTHYISWFMLGKTYLFGVNEFDNVIDLDQAIEALTSAARYINPDIGANAEAKALAAEIWFYLGVAKYNKHNDLKSQGKEADAKTVLEGALQAFERSCGYSESMLAHYNASKCKALTGNISGTLSDLEALILKDRNYCLTAFSDKDFSSMQNDCLKLIEQMKHRVFVKAEVKYSKIKKLVEELEALDGSFNESIPQLAESLPYFDVLDCNNEFDDMIPRIEHLIVVQKNWMQKQADEESERQRQEEQKRQYREKRCYQKFKKYYDCISVGGYHTVGLKTDGTVIAVGKNDDGQCDTSSWRNIVAIAAESYHTVGLKADDTVVVVGKNGDGQCDTSSWRDIVAIAAGSYHTVGLKADGTVVAVGKIGDGQCDTSSWRDIVAIAAGSYHTVGLKADGTVVAVGKIGDGQCDTSSWRDIVAIAAGSYHTVGLKADGTIVAAGCNDNDRCDTSSWRDIVAISSAGGYHTVGLKVDGTVVAAGENGYGQCDTSSWRDIVAISVGSYHTVGLKADGTVVVVGKNGDGQCDTSSWRDIGPVNKEKINKRERAKREEKKKREEQTKLWISQGLCHHCGGKLSGMFTKKCKSCGELA